MGNIETAPCNPRASKLLEINEKDLPSSTEVVDFEHLLSAPARPARGQILIFSFSTDPVENEKIEI
jgi:hypothetical protein